MRDSGDCVGDDNDGGDSTGDNDGDCVGGDDGGDGNNGDCNSYNDDDVVSQHSTG